MIDSPRFRTGPGSHRPGGFTVIEMLVTLLLLTLLILGMLAVFEFSNRVARVQVNTSEMQQSQRVAQQELVRVTRMASRGGLPIGALPDGLALAVDNNVPANTFIDSPADTIPVVEGTDVLTLRGVFETPVYSIDEDSFAFVSPAGSFTVRKLVRPGVPVEQDLEPLIDAVQNGRPAAMILVSGLDDQFYHVVEITGGVVVSPDEVQVTFVIDGGTYNTEYNLLSTTGAGPCDAANDFCWDDVLTDGVAYAGLLEEVRYYIREDRVLAAQATSDLKPRLSRARLYPGTQAAWAGDASNWQEDLADNVLDLQVALGFDINAGAGFDQVVTDTQDDTDEWLFNHPGDDPTDAAWVAAPKNLYYVRVSSLVVSDRRDRDFQAEDFLALEDHQYQLTPADPLNGDLRRMFRRRAMQTVVELRSVS